MFADPFYSWIILGIFFLIIEMLTGTFVILFVSVGMLLTGLACLIPVIQQHTEWQTIIFAAISVLGLLFLKRPIQHKMLRSASLKVDMGKEILTTQAIRVHETVRIQYQGSEWNATNVGDEELKESDHALIIGIDGNILLIKKRK